METNGTALLVVDLQKDFVSGSLAVKGADEIVNNCLELMARATEKSVPIVATRCWHPADHCSFSEHGGVWPPHCVKMTEGAEFVDELPSSILSAVVSKGQNPEADAYSGFDGTDLDGTLRRMGVNRLIVCGLATDYCVMHTVSSALESDYEVVVVRDAVAAVDQVVGDGDRALDRMRDRGAKVVALEEAMEPA